MTTAAAQGIGGFAGILFAVFLALKLIGAIALPWWLVFAPAWVPIVFIIIWPHGKSGR